MTAQAMNSILNDAQAALKNRLYFSAYPENPKAYAEDGMKQVKPLLVNNSTKILLNLILIMQLVG